MRLQFMSVGALACTLALVGCEGAMPTQALAPGEASLAKKVESSNEWVEINYSMADPCSPEVVDLSGRVHVKSKTSVDKNGTYQTKSHINWAGVKGVGQTTGLEYVSNGTSKEVTYTYQTGAFRQEFKEGFHLISKGGGPNYKSHVVWVFTVDENGNTTYDIEERTTCN